MYAILLAYSALYAETLRLLGGFLKYYINLNIFVNSSVKELFNLF